MLDHDQSLAMRDLVGPYARWVLKAPVAAGAFAFLSVTVRSITFPTKFLLS